MTYNVFGGTFNLALSALSISTVPSDGTLCAQQCWHCCSIQLSQKCQSTELLCSFWHDL